MQTTNQQIRNAVEHLKKALEESGKKNVVIIYSYVGQSENTESPNDVVYTSFVSDMFTQVLATCDLVKNDLLNP